MAHVVGDIVDYSGLVQDTDSALLAAAIDALFGELRALVRAQRGTLANFAGDALYAVWDLAAGDTCEQAGEFVLAAADAVRRVAPTLGVQNAGEPLRMGWGVTAGEAAMTLLAGSVTTVLGDATNVAFRLSGLAGRAGRPEILVEESARALVADSFTFGEGLVLDVKGRAEPVVAHGLTGRGG
jgi:class 3 adenylate cyclase